LAAGGMSGAVAGLGGGWMGLSGGGGATGRAGGWTDGGEATTGFGGSLACSGSKPSSAKALFKRESISIWSASFFFGGGT